MIRYELKDKERHAALEKALPGFTEALKKVCTPMCGIVKGGQGINVHNYGPDIGWISGEWSISLPTDDIEVVTVYDPRAWNNYPKVTPPEGVLMRIEGQYAKRPELEYYGALMYLEGAWHFADTVEIADNVIVERFRPWNDEEAAK